MALTLNTTTSDQYANSYVSLDYADDYWAAHFSTTKAALWTALNDDQKASLLIQACRVIETVRCTARIASSDAYGVQYDTKTHIWIGTDTVNAVPVKHYYFQALQFPRNLDYDVRSGARFVPEGVMMAQCEQAVYLISYDETNQANRNQGIGEETLKVGNIYTRRTYAQDASAVAPMAFEMLRPFTIKSSSTLRRA